MPEFKVRDPDTGRTVTLRGDSPPSEAELEEIFSTLAPPQEVSLLDRVKDLGSAIEEGFQSIPGAPQASEFAAGITRGATELLDIVPKGLIGAANIAGAGIDPPTFGDLVPEKGAFAGPGLATDVAATAGEFIPSALTAGGLLRSAAQRVPAFFSGEAASSGLLRQLGQTTAAQDIGLGAVAGAGSAVGEEVGGETGALVGALLAPIGGVAATAGIKTLLNAGASGIRSLFSGVSQSTANMSADGASTLLAEAMIREGIGPDEIINRMTQLGPEAIPADAATSFARLLRAASNKVPRIEGQSREVLNTRQTGQAPRILTGLDDATGTSSLNVTDEIERLNTVMRPQITRLYEEAGQQPLQLSQRLQTMFQGDNDVARALNTAQRRLNNKRAAGDVITNIDIIDTTKQVLDDKIGKLMRQGATNQARDIIRIKNVMVREADASIPVYAEGRNLFAGKAALETAATAGEGFLKMTPKDIANITETMGISEKRMFKLGAKEAVLDAIDGMQTGADATRRLFGKNGSLKKLKSLFDDEQSFNNFSDVLKRESNFTFTRREAQANSTTVKQMTDLGEANQVLSDAAEAFSTPTAMVSVLNRISGGLAKQKSSEEFTKAMEAAGDILLSKGMDPVELQALLRRGQRSQIEAALRRRARTEIVAPRASAIGTEVIQEFLDE